jgi:hypothetical protein
MVNMIHFVHNFSKVLGLDLPDSSSKMMRYTSTTYPIAVSNPDEKS